jgi:GT2 family glycosyltransferase
MCHFAVMKRSLMERLDGLNSEYDNAQDYDMVLRVSEMTTKIHHIRKILYHNRIQGKHPEKLSYTILEAGKKALDAHIDRVGLKGKVYINNNELGYFHVIYDIIGNPFVSIVIPNKDDITALKTCVDSILKRSTYNNYEIVIVENNSKNGEMFAYYRELEKHPKIRVLYYPENGFNYSKLINFGVKNCSSDYIVQLNNDTEVITPNWLELMLGFAQRSDVGAVGAKLLYPDGSIQHAGIYMYYYRMQYHIKHIFYSNSIQNYIAVTGACMMSRRELYEKVNYMNEELAVQFNDIDFCFSLQNKNYYIVYNPFVELYHYESKTRGNNNTPEKIALCSNEFYIFYNKWSEVIHAGDPYMNKGILI